MNSNESQPTFHRGTARVSDDFEVIMFEPDTAPRQSPLAAITSDPSQAASLDVVAQIIATDTERSEDPALLLLGDSLVDAIRIAQDVPNVHLDPDLFPTLSMWFILQTPAVVAKPGMGDSSPETAPIQAIHMMWCDGVMMLDLIDAAADRAYHEAWQADRPGKAFIADRAGAGKLIAAICVCLG